MAEKTLQLFLFLTPMKKNQIISFKIHFVLMKVQALQFSGHASLNEIDFSFGNRPVGLKNKKIILLHVILLKLYIFISFT